MYLAKVDNAATSSQTGLKWFKIYQDTFNTSSKKWGVGTYHVILTDLFFPSYYRSTAALEYH